MVQFAVIYDDFVYSWGDDMFICISNFNIDLEDWDHIYPEDPIDFEYWDVRNPNSPNLHQSPMITFRGPKCEWWSENKPLLNRCIQIPYLVVYTTEISEKLFLAVRFAVPGMGPDGSIGDKFFHKGWRHKYPYKTVGFSIFRVDESNGRISSISASDGFPALRDINETVPSDSLAMFVGTNHAFAVPVGEFAGIKKNAIYFTDPGMLTPPDSDQNMAFGGHDIGVFDYETKTISSCYHYPRDAKSFRRIMPPPMWFTPRYSD